VIFTEHGIVRQFWPTDLAKRWLRWPPTGKTKRAFSKVQIKPACAIAAGFWPAAFLKSKNAQ